MIFLLKFPVCRIMAQKWRKSLIKKSQRTHYNKNTAFRSEATLPLPGGGRGVGQTKGACRKRQATVRKKQVEIPAFFVPGAGVEPAQPCGYWCLRPARLPIPPSGLVFSGGCLKRPAVSVNKGDKGM